MHKPNTTTAAAFIRRIATNRQYRVLFTMLLLHTLVAGLHIRQQGLTTDERAYYIYSIRWLHGNVDRIQKTDDSKTPLTVLSAIPRTIIQLVKPDYRARDNGLHDMRMGRFCMVLYPWIIAVYFFIWCRKLFGGNSWVLPLLFFLFDPMVLAYSMIIGSDMATGACVIAVFYHAWRWFATSSRQHFLYCAIWVGVGCVAKPSLLYLLPCGLLLYGLLLCTKWLRFSWQAFTGYVLAGLVVVLVTINCAYFFKSTLRPLGKLPTHSNFFAGVQNKVPLLRHLPVPVPASYYASVDLLQHHKEVGGGQPNSSYPGVYLNGRFALNKGFYNYYLLVGWYKLPLPTLVLLLFSVVLGVLYFKPKRFLEVHIWYAWPVLFFLLLLSLFNSFQIGLRHVLTFYPLLFLGIAAVLQYCRQSLPATQTFSWALFVWMIISVGIYFPHLIPYTNELLNNKKMVYLRMNDSNIDYSQSLPALRQYVASHPQVTPAPATPAAGKFIVAMQQLNPYNIDTPTTRTWLRDFEPTQHYQYSLLLYHIKPADLKRLGYGR